jgi:hypothetical protein
MPKYLISGLPVHYRYEGNSIIEQTRLSIEVKKGVDVKNLAELQAEFDAHCAELTGNGKQCYRMDATPYAGVRAFAGFKKASAKNGPLNRVINSEEAIAKAKATV